MIDDRTTFILAAKKCLEEAMVYAGMNPTEALVQLGLAEYYVVQAIKHLPVEKEVSPKSEIYSPAQS